MAALRHANTLMVPKDVRPGKQRRTHNSFSLRGAPSRHRIYVQENCASDRNQLPGTLPHMCVQAQQETKANW